MSHSSNTPSSDVPEESRVLTFVVESLIRFLCEFLRYTYAARAVGLLLIALRFESESISNLVDVTVQTVNNWRRSLSAMTDYQSFRAFLHRPEVEPGSKLMAHESAIKAKLEEKNYGTVSEIRDMITVELEVQCSEATVRRMLHALGYKCLKVGSMPAKAAPAKQKEFFDEILEPLMKRAKKGEIVLYFMDAAHFVHGCDFLGHVWCLVKRYVKTYSGRNRHNVLAALSYAERDLQIVANDTYITATEVCEMLRQLAAVRDEKESGPVYIVLDNARYQKCKVVTELAAELDINLVYLPPYSPNLNLVERLWKLVKGELRTRYYGEFETFKQRIHDILEVLWTTYEVRMQNILAKPQLFDGLRPVCENTYELPRKPKDAAQVSA